MAGGYFHFQIGAARLRVYLDIFADLRTRLFHYFAIQKPETKAMSDLWVGLP